MNELTLTALTTLAVKINALNEQANYHANQALVFAAKCGEKLLFAKAECNHGEFKAWLENNCSVSYSHAKNFMRIAKEMPELLNPKGQSIVFLNVTQAIELLNAPEEIKADVIERVENGEDVTVKEIQRLKREALELAEKHKAVQTELNTVKTQYDFSKQRVEHLNSTIELKVNEIVAKKSADLIMQNQQQFQELTVKLENAKADLEQTKKEHEKDVKNRVSHELKKFDNEVDAKQSKIAFLERVKSELDSEVGNLVIHKEAIKNAKEYLSFLSGAFGDAFETGTIPPETCIEWQKLK